MYEVEVKAHLKNRQAVIKKLESLGCKFSKELHQIDRIFIPEGVSFPPPLNVPVLRVRNQNGLYLLTLKISQSNRTDSIEKEIEIMDGEKMIEILQLLKWQEVVKVDKKRVKTNLNDMEIVLDDVKDLGEFIEAEQIVTNDNPNERKKMQGELFAVLATLGVPEEDNIIDGKYDLMLNNIYKKLGVK